MDLGLAGLGVLVTGGAGGIGAAVVRAFEAGGAKVAVHYRTTPPPDAAVALRADLTVEAEADALIPAAREALGRLDVCVANAGAWPREHVPVKDLSLERWRATLDANLTSVFLTARAFLRHASEGALVLVGSTAGVFGEAGHADYAAAKGALLSGLLLSLKNEAAPVRVNAVAPGWTVTPMTAGRLDPADVERVTATMALKKVATAEDVARAVVWLASPVAAGHVTGQVVTVAGGMEGRLV